MVGKYLEDLYQELYEQEIILEQKKQKKENEFENNIRFIETLKDSLDEDFEPFTPRKVDEENHKKIDFLTEEQEKLEEEIKVLQSNILVYDSKIKKLEAVMEDFRKNWGYIDVPLDSNDFISDDKDVENIAERFYGYIQCNVIPDLTLLAHKAKICNNLIDMDSVRCKLELREIEKECNSIIIKLQDMKVL